MVEKEGLVLCENLICKKKIRNNRIFTGKMSLRVVYLVSVHCNVYLGAAASVRKFEVVFYKGVVRMKVLGDRKFTII